MLPKNTVASERADPVAFLAEEEFLWGIGSLCQLHRIPFDGKLLLGQFPGPHSQLTLIEAATRLGLGVIYAPSNENP